MVSFDQMCAQECIPFIGLFIAWLAPWLCLTNLIPDAGSRVGSASLAHHALLQICANPKRRWLLQLFTFGRYFWSVIHHWL